MSLTDLNVQRFWGIYSTPKYTIRKKGVSILNNDNLSQHWAFSTDDGSCLVTGFHRQVDLPPATPYNIVKKKKKKN